MDKELIASELLKIAKDLHIASSSRVGGRSSRSIKLQEALRLILKNRMSVVAASSGMPFDLRGAVTEIRKRKNDGSVRAELYDDGNVSITWGTMGLVSPHEFIEFE